MNTPTPCPITRTPHQRPSTRCFDWSLGEHHDEATWLAVGALEWQLDYLCETQGQEAIPQPG
ncbi:MAG: hypothetical protein QF733_10405, partial [Phycisphaerales bacterium]|nr:hypothetical protein [Phycisphaerales bacterium]